MKNAIYKIVDILSFVADKKEFTTETIVRQLGFTATTAKRYLGQLIEYNPLRFDAPVSGTYMIKIGNYPARKVVVIR